MATAIEIINTIRDHLPTEYAKIVPEATLSNLPQVGDAITSNKNIINAFCGFLFNEVGMRNIKTLEFNNTLKVFKGVDVPMGGAIQDIYINPATDIGYQVDGTYLLKTTKPDGKVAYYGLNRESTFPQSISKNVLKQAFSSVEKFEEFYTTCIASLYAGDEVEEFVLGKNVIGKTIDEGAVKIVDADIAQPKELSKSIYNMSRYFQFPSTEFCGYNHVNADKITAGEKPCQVACKIERQALVVRADVLTEMNFEYWASLFHLELAQIKAMIVEVDDIPSNDYDVYAVLCDRSAIQMRDAVYELDSEYLGSNMHINYWLHHFQYIYVSMFGNMVAFAKKKTTEQ